MSMTDPGAEERAPLTDVAELGEFESDLTSEDWAAKLRANKTDSNLLMLKINMGAGHGGKSGRWERLHEVAETYGFVLTQVGE